VDTTADCVGRNRETVPLAVAGDKFPKGEAKAVVPVELLVAANVVTINIFDEADKPTSAKGFSGSVLTVSGASRETVPLAVASENSLKGEALVLKDAAGKSGQVKF